MKFIAEKVDNISFWFSEVIQNPKKHQTAQVVIPIVVSAITAAIVGIVLALLKM
jgi:hypothetical protein